MFINYKEIRNLAWLDTCFFDKEGFLFVKNYFQQNSNDYIKRFCRLKGNILFILKIPYLRKEDLESKKLINFYKNDSINNNSDNYLIYILILNDFALRIKDKLHSYEFLIEFDLKEKLNFEHKNKWIFMSSSHQKRDEWINLINTYNHLYYKSFFNNLIQKKNKLLENKFFNYKLENILDKKKKIFLEYNNLDVPSTLEFKETSKNIILSQISVNFSFTLFCKIENYFLNNFEPNIFIKIFYFNSINYNWIYLDKTEILNSSQIQFSKKIYFDLFSKENLKLTKIEFKFYVYDVIESLTERKILLGTASGYLEDNQNKNFNIFSIIQKNKQIGIIKMNKFENQLNIFNNSNLLEDKNKQISKSSEMIKNKSNSTNVSTSETLKSFNDKLKINHDLPFYELSPSISNKTQHYKNLMEYPSLTNSKFFLNIIHRSFQFDLINIDKNNPFKVNIIELMAEPTLAFLIPENLMNIFMDDEKKLMNCITYSLGEVKPEYQRKQMQILELHLRFINLITESINNLNQYQYNDKFFRQSSQKKDIFLQFVALNLHLQRSIFIKNHFSRNDIEKNENFNILNLYTHGAFCAHKLGFENGGMNKLMHDIENGSKESNLFYINKVWIVMKNYFNVLFLSKEIKDLINNIINLINKSGLIQPTPNELDLEMSDQKHFITQISYQKKILKLFNKVEEHSQNITKILDLKKTDKILGSLDIFRIQNIETKTKDNLIERTISCPLDKVQKSKINLEKTEKKLKQMRKSNSVNKLVEQFEFEPIDLIHLNIKASLISIQSKLNSLINYYIDKYKNKKKLNEKINFNIYEMTINEMKPSCKKLFNSIDNLLKTSSICYALESIKLTKEQLEYFYLIRLRRNIVYSQVLSTVIIGLVGELSCPSSYHNNYLEEINFHEEMSNCYANFLEKLFEQKKILIYFEGLLSCYADEIGMLQDMAWAIEELNNCVQIIFINSYYNSKSNNRCILSLPLENDKIWSYNTLHMPKIEGNGYQTRVKISIYSKNLPEEFTCKITSILFNIGINENATLAETFGYVKIQEEINKKSFCILENFVSTCANLENNLLINNLNALKTELYSSRAKNVRILYLAEQIAYDLHALRFTNCKSGKDRTAMAVTLEQIRRCSSLFNFNEITQTRLFQQMLDTLRSEGTRRENTRKNIGIAKYAFNSLQVMTLPKLYRPPRGTYGNVQT